MEIMTFDKKNQFFNYFDNETGKSIRTGIYKNKKDSGIDPFMRDFPELIDIGICGHCDHGKSGLCIQAGIQCYQSGLTRNDPNMSLENYKKIIDESKGKVFQVALGGSGDPNKHENFKEILEYTCENNIVPNYTTSGLDLKDEEVEITKKYCGAVAISQYSRLIKNDDGNYIESNFYTENAINKFLKAGVKTNIHYVLGNNTIDEAVIRLKNDLFPRDINAIIFLLHKPVGLGRNENVLKFEDLKVKEFFELIDNGKFNFKIGFDSCSIPGVLNFTKNINKMSMDTCEGARFSAYISSDMVCLPCSFDQDHKWGYDISNDTIQNAWNSTQFENFRNHLKESCPSCKNRLECMGGCPIKSEIVLCNRKDKIC